MEHYWDASIGPFYTSPCVSFLTFRLHDHRQRLNFQRIPNIPFFYLVFRAYSHWKVEYQYNPANCQLN